MRRFLLSFLVLFIMGVASAQTTVFTDNFNISTGSTYTAAALAPIGTSLVWFLSRSGADWGARIDGGILDMTNDASGAANVAGWGFAWTDSNSFTSPYNSILSSNPGVVTWTFNMRQIRLDPAGFGAGSYGVAFILGGNSIIANNTGYGYAVVLGETGATDPVRLAKYTTGLSGTLTNIITSNTAGLTDFGAEYLSIKVTYDPSTNTWELFLRNDGALAFADPASGSLTSQGTAVDNTYTGVGLGYLGGYWQGSTTGAQTAFYDNVTVIVGAAATNTITTGAVTSPPFVLTDCLDTETGTVAFTTTGVFGFTNSFSAQLSDDVGSFAAPINIGTITVGGSGPFPNIPITIPAGTVSGTGYLIRVVSDMPAVTGSSSVAFTITQQAVGGCFSSHTDYYRSAATGNWASVSTWQSSPDNSNWISATLVPTYLADTITIRNTHTVTVLTGGSADQLIISNGGILEHSGGAFTIEDGTGDDIDIQSGGVLLLSTIATSPSFGAGSPTINVATGGTVRVSAASLTGAGTGVNANNYLYQHQSVLEYTLTSPFSTSSVTYFPNAGPGTIPIFRTTAAIGAAVGAGAFTIINGVFECNGDISFQLGGTKTFRNGIRGTGTITALGTSGMFIINGVTAELGGSGGLILPTTGLQIGTPTTVTMISDKTITGNVSLLTDTYVQLGNFNLTVSGTVSNATITSYIKTNGTGKLKLLSVGSGLGGKLFPIGLTSINPLFISSPTLADYSARIVEPITPPIFANNQAVLRTWYISSSLNTPNATISFGYSFPGVPGECGPFYSNTSSEIGVNISGLWNIVQTGLIPAAFPLVPGTFIVTPNPINYFNNSATEFPFVIANNFAILPIDCIISTRAQKINNTGIISWTVNSCSEVRSFEVQRSVNNSGFQTIGTVNPVTNQIDFSFTDAALAGGRNLYRIRVNGITGSSKYSNTVALIYNSNDIFISSLVPNPVHDIARLTVSTGRNAAIDFKIYNAAGNLVKQWNSVVTEGNNTIELNVGELAAGMYTVFAFSNESKTISRFIKL
jgi:Secretion system C-terminal sorting domain